MIQIHVKAERIKCQEKYGVTNEMVYQREPFPEDKSCYFNCISQAFGITNSDVPKKYSNIMEFVQTLNLSQKTMDGITRCYTSTKSLERCKRGDASRLCMLKLSD